MNVPLDTVAPFSLCTLRFRIIGYLLVVANSVNWIYEQSKLDVY